MDGVGDENLQKNVRDIVHHNATLQNSASLLRGSTETIGMPPEHKDVSRRLPVTWTQT